jgi:hypothetical protein
MKKRKEGDEILSKLIKILAMTLVVVTMLLVSVTGTVFANGRIDGPDYAIEVSPNVLNIDSYGNAGNIHSNIPASGFTVDTLMVNGTEITFGTGVDSTGDLVINFDIDTFKDTLVTGEYAKFVLTGFYVEGDPITVEDSVPVISVL